MSKGILSRILVYFAFSASCMFGQTISSTILGTLADPERP